MSFESENVNNQNYINMLLFLTGRLVQQSSGKIQVALSQRCHFCQFNVKLSPFGFRQQSSVNLRQLSRYKTKLNNNVGKKNPKKQKEKLSEFRRLFGLASSEKWRLASAIALLTVSSGVTMSVPFLIGKVIDHIYTEDKSQVKDKIKQLSLAMLCIFVIGGACNFGRVYLMNTTAYRITQSLRKKVYSSILRQETAMFDRVSTGELVGRLTGIFISFSIESKSTILYTFVILMEHLFTGDAQLVSSSITSNISDGLRSGMMSLACVSMMIFISPKLATVCILIIPPLSVLSIFYGRFVKQMTKNVQDSLAVLNSTAEEKISNIRVVKAFGKEISEINNYEIKLQNLMDLCTKESLYRGLFFGAAGFFGNMMALSVLCYGGFMVSDETITVGNLSSFLLYAAYMGFSLNGIVSFYSELNKALGASTRLFELIDREAALPIQGGKVLDKLDGQIAFEAVTFAYPTRKDVRIFDNFNLVIPKCKTMAIVGQSGSGKSTVAALLLRLYDPDSGRILLDGYEIKQLDPLWLKSQFGLVSQEAILFNGTIRQNIMYGKEDASQKQVMDVIEQANVLEFVKRLPQGLDTLVGERGVTLSGGQRQRVVIARALIKVFLLFILFLFYFILLNTIITIE